MSLPFAHHWRTNLRPLTCYTPHLMTKTDFDFDQRARKRGASKSFRRRAEELTAEWRDQLRRREVLWGRGDEIASIGTLLTERWLHRRRCHLADGAHRCASRKSRKPLDDLGHSLTPFEPKQTLIAVIR